MVRRMEKKGSKTLRLSNELSEPGQDRIIRQSVGSPGPGQGRVTRFWSGSSGSAQDRTTNRRISSFRPTKVSKILGMSSRHVIDKIHRRKSTRTSYIERSGRGDLKLNTFRFPAKNSDNPVENRMTQVLRIKRSDGEPKNLI